MSCRVVPCRVVSCRVVSCLLCAEWEDASFTGEEFGKGRADGTLKLAFGAVPALQIGDNWFVQCNAILLYINKVSGWHPEDPIEQYNIEAALLGVTDLRDATVNHAPLFGATAADVAKYRETVLPRRLKELAALLGDNEYVANNKFSVADASLFDMLEAITSLQPGAVDEFPTLVAYMDRYKARAKTAAYLARDSRHGAFPSLDAQLEIAAKKAAAAGAGASE